MEKINEEEHTEVAVVTGSNKGIGLEICRQLASNGTHVVLTARDERRGLEAAKKLQESGLSNVVFHQLDVTDPDSIASLANFIKTSYGKLDILINNAGITGVVVDRLAMEAVKLPPGPITDESTHLLVGIVEQTYEMAEECLEINFYGTKRVTEALLPLLQVSQSARIVNMSSCHGQLKYLNNENVKEQLESIEILTMEKLESIAELFLRDFKDSKLKENGWPLVASAYKVSKTLINAYSRLVAKAFPKCRVNCVHPGYVRTDMTGSRGNMNPEEGARAPVMLALLPPSGPSGLYFDQMEPSCF